MFYRPRPISSAAWNELGLDPGLFDRWTSGVFSGTRVIAGQNGKKLLVTDPGNELLMRGTAAEVDEVASRLCIDI